MTIEERWATGSDDLVADDGTIALPDFDTVKKLLWHADSALALEILKYADDQPRDEQGRFAASGGSMPRSGSYAQGSGVTTAHRLRAQMQKAGLDASRLTFAREPKMTTLGGARAFVDGEYDPHTGKIIIYPGLGAKKAELVLAHEIGHAKLDSVLDEPDVKAALGLDVVDPRSKVTQQALKRDDGISRYSREHWEGSGYSTAVDETIAEVARLRALGEKDEVIFKDRPALRAAVAAVEAAVKRKGRR